MLLHIFHKWCSLCNLFTAKALHHLIVVHLQPGVQDIYLEAFLSVILISAKAECKEDEYTSDAYKEIILERSLFQKHSHIQNVSLVVSRIALSFCAIW